MTRRSPNTRSILQASWQDLYFTRFKLPPLVWPCLGIYEQLVTESLIGALMAPFPHDGA